MKSATLALMLAAGLSAGGAQATNLVQNGSFEGGTHTGGIVGGYITMHAPSALISGWAVTAGSADWIYRGLWQASDGDYSLDMSGLSAGTVESNPFPTVVGQVYELTFDMAGNFANQVLHNDHSKEMGVAAGDANQVFTFATPYPDWAASDPVALMYPNMHWVSQTMRFTATDTQTRIVFTSLEDSYYGAALDNVSVSAVPEPGLPALMLAGLGLIGMRLRRRAG